MNITRKNLIRKRIDSSRKHTKYRSLIFDIPCLIVQERQLKNSNKGTAGIHFCDPKEWPQFSGNTVFSDELLLSNPMSNESIEIIIERINILMNENKYKIISACFV
jgi:hypothetical protein